ncbi:MAG: hypothetical protein H7199_09965 [Burkholderiales bacterium]|nr:hypothetical protein [Flavobacterium sp.]
MKTLIFTTITMLILTAASAQTQEKTTTTTTQSKIENPMDPTAKQEVHISTTTTKLMTVKRKPAVRKKTVTIKRTSRSRPLKALIQTKVTVPAQ